jgi:hypothetical protein
MTDGTDNEGQNPKQDYEIGYGRPPKKTQFKPGQSGNPKGRKRKPKSLQAQMQRAAAKKVRINEGGKAKLLPLQEVIIRSIVNKAAKGDLRAASFVFNVLQSPEFADTDVISQNTLSSEDQAMFEQVMKQFEGTDGSDLLTQFDPTNAEPKPVMPPPTSAPPAPVTATQIEKDDGSDE